ncbi:hypothetical protein Tco_1311929 [Tanacetum coccineum]
MQFNDINNDNVLLVYHLNRTALDLYGIDIRRLSPEFLPIDAQLGASAVTWMPSRKELSKWFYSVTPLSSTSSAIVSEVSGVKNIRIPCLLIRNSSAFSARALVKMSPIEIPNRRTQISLPQQRVRHLFQPDKEFLTKLVTWCRLSGSTNRCRGDKTLRTLRYPLLGDTTSNYAIASGTIPPKKKGSKKKANTDTIIKQKPPTAPKEKKSGKGKQKTTELETISEADLTEAEQLKIITKRSRQETHSSHASGSGADEGTDDEDSDNEVKGANVEGAKSDEDATYEENQGNEAVEDTNTDLDGRDDVLTDVILPQVQATQEIEDTHVTLTPVNPDGQQQSSSVSSGFVSNMLNPNQDTGVDDIFGQHTEATSLIDTPVTAIMEPSFTAQTNRPPTPYPLVIQTQQPPILTPATTTSSSLQNLPNFASLFGFDYRLKALEDNFSELRQTNQYAEALSSIPGIVDQYLANKMQEAVDVAVQLKYDRIREESNTANQQFLDSIDEGMKKIIKEQVKKEVSKITPKIEKLVTELESEVLVGSSNAPSETTTTTAGKTTTTGSKTHKKSASQSAPVEETMQTTDVFEAPAHQEFETGVHDEQAEEEFQHLLMVSTTDTIPFLIMLGIKVYSCRPTFELMKGTCKSLTELEYFCEEVYKATTEKLDWINPEGRQYPHDLRQPLPLVPNSQGRHVIPFHHFINNDLEYLRGGVSSRNQLIVKYDKICPQGNLLWAKIEDKFYAFATQGIRSMYEGMMDVLYKFKEGDFNDKGQTLKLCCSSRARKSDKLSTQGSLYILLRSKRILLRGNTDKKNRLMRIDELHKFSDGTLDDVRTALNDRLKGIRMEYLPQTFWSQRDKANARAMIQAIDKRLKTRRIMRSLERFVGGRPYGGVGSYKAVRLRFSDPMIQPEPEGSTQGYPLVSVEVLRVNSFTMKMEILLEPTSNKLMVEHAEYDESNTYVLERFNTTAGNPVKKILLKLNLSDHRLFKMVVECRSVKVKEFQERCNIKAFQEWYEHVGPEVASPQDGKVSRWQRDCAWLMISRCSRSQCQIQVQGTSSIQEVNDHYNIFTRESQEYELKTKDKA